MNNLLNSGTLLTDQQLWIGIRGGDEKAFASLFERYHRVLYNYGCKLHSDTDLIEDAIQEVFIDIWRLRSNLTSEVQSVKFYLYRAIRRRIQGLDERHEIVDKLDNISDSVIREMDHSTGLIDAESADLLLRRIHTLIANLPPRQLEVLTLRYFDGFQVHEIAGLMNINEKSVRNLLFKAIFSLREKKNWLIISLLLPLFYLIFSCRHFLFS